MTSTEVVKASKKRKNDESVKKNARKKAQNQKGR